MKIINKTKNKGFSLIELMVVVAIIGVLAAVAIPSFNGFQKRARSSEAKTNLGSIYTAEKGYNYEQNSYSSTLSIIGFGSPDGKREYAVGFAGSAGVNYYGTGNTANGLDYSTQSATVATTMASTCETTSTAFVACATGTSNTASDYKIDQAKKLDACSSLGC